MRGKPGSTCFIASRLTPFLSNGCGASNAVGHVSALESSSSLRTNVLRMPARSGSHSTTAAPAPSPNSTHVLRSVQLVMRVRRSPPTTSARRNAVRREAPSAPSAEEAIMDSAMVKP